MIPILNNSGTSTSERILLREDAVRIMFFVFKLFYSKKYFVYMHNSLCYV
jgi:hypothetical protein